MRGLSPSPKTKYFQVKASNVKNVNLTPRYQYRERRFEFFKICFMIKYFCIFLFKIFLLKKKQKHMDCSHSFVSFFLVHCLLQILNISMTYTCMIFNSLCVGMRLKYK